MTEAGVGVVGRAGAEQKLACGATGGGDVAAAGGRGGMNGGAAE